MFRALVCDNLMYSSHGRNDRAFGLDFLNSVCYHPLQCFLHLECFSEKDQNSESYGTLVLFPGLYKNGLGQRFPLRLSFYWALTSFLYIC